MLIGPVFRRQLAISPRRVRTYVARTTYGLVLLGLMCIAWTMLTGTQLVRDVGDFARFGMLLLEILAPLQLALAVFFSATLAASAVAEEKDRRTLLLLLLTRLSNSELVLGKLLASLLVVLMLLAAALPIFMISTLLGGVSFDQVGRVFVVTLASVLVCGSLGSTLALWREKTFQALALTVLLLVLWLAVWEIVATGALGSQWWGMPCQSWAIGFSPWQAILEATRPDPLPEPALGLIRTPLNLFVLVAGLIAIGLNGLAVARVRVWNPSRQLQLAPPEAETGREETIWSLEYRKARAAAEGAETTAVAPTIQRTRSRRVWDNPILWREICTWAYGRKVLAIRLAYLVLFTLAAGSLYWMVHSGVPVTRAGASMALVPLFLLSLVLLNAQAVTALTSERDAGALDLLLVTDLTPKEIVFGKLGGIFYNTKEMVLLPMLLCASLWLIGAVSLEDLFYVLVGLAVLYVFAATLGVHTGMTYANSASAVATSLGTIFFLLVGVATCMRMMVAFSGSFEAQLAPFLAVTLLGGVGLYAALGIRNPSTAIGAASFLCPLATFYAITSFLLNYTLAVFLVTVAAYGFMTAAMLVPAICEFDVATGRTTANE